VLNLLLDLLLDGPSNLLLLTFAGCSELRSSTFVGLLLCGQNKHLGCDKLCLRCEAALIVGAGTFHRENWFSYHHPRSILTTFSMREKSRRRWVSRFLG
jgi:hypothetical protein